jgi:hypothetical protein
MGYSIERAERVHLNSVLAHSQASSWRITVSDRELVRLSEQIFRIDKSHR